jgi:hypothetical protein
MDNFCRRYFARQFGTQRLENDREDVSFELGRENGAKSTVDVSQGLHAKKLIAGQESNLVERVLARAESRPR